MSVLGAGLILGLLACARYSQGKIDIAAGDAVLERRLNAYPNDFILTKPYNEDPNNWLVFIHCIGMLYMLLGLNTVCDVYFAGALEIMTEAWNIKPDIAGATFMAAGGSAPELFTSLLGAVVSESDVGFGTIVGSAVFNVLFVIGCCGLVAPGGILLTWWPLFRDCSYYILSLGVLAWFAYSGGVSLAEAIILFCMYIGYCLIMVINEQLESKAQGIVDMIKGKSSEVHPLSDNDEPKDDAKADGKNGAASTAYGKLDEDGAPKDAAVDAFPAAGNFDVEAGTVEDDAATKKDQDGEEEVATELAAPAEAGATKLHVADIAGFADGDEITIGEEEHVVAGTDSPGDDRNGFGFILLQTPLENSYPVGTAVTKKEEEDAIDFFDWPEGALNQLYWILTCPVTAPLWYLTPIPRVEKNMFAASFLIALVWIAMFSTFLVWWIEILTEILQLPIIVMGFTVLAAGTSIPDLISSMAVAKKGEGDMAVSSSIGSNIFDILVGLPIPWIIKIAFVEGLGNGVAGFEVRITSPYITFYVLILLFMVLATILSIHCNGWRLNKYLGPAMIILWLLFLLVAILTEMGEPDLGILR